jgi:hypothetical protein
MTNGQTLYNEKVEMNQLLRDKLVSMKEEDLRVRAELAADGSLFDGYHPRMEEVHRHNASQLREIIDVHGWPGIIWPVRTAQRLLG